MHQCAFCPNGAIELTGEHLWGDWLNDVIPIEKYRMIRTEKDGTVRTWRTNLLNEKFKVVCDRCNSGWMSELESRTKQFASGMVAQCSPVILQPRDVATIAALTLAKAVVAEHRYNHTHPTLSYGERHLFAETLEFPPGVQMWLASRPILHGIFDNDYLEPPINTRGGAFKAQVFTYGIGYPVVQLTILRYKSKRRRKYADQLSFRQDHRWEDFSVPLWPSTGAVVSWPPRKHLPNELVEAFIQRWKHLNDRRF